MHLIKLDILSKFSSNRQFFLSQFGEGENLDETGILEMDLAQLSIEQAPRDQDAEKG